MISASKLRAAIKQLKARAEESAITPELRSKQARAVDDARKLARAIGIDDAITRLERHDGRMKVAILVDVDALPALRESVRLAALKMVTKGARADVEFAKTARDAGLTIRRARTPV